MARNYKRDNIGRFAPKSGGAKGARAKKVAKAALGFAGSVATRALIGDVAVIAVRNSALRVKA